MYDALILYRIHITKKHKVQVNLTSRWDRGMMLVSNYSLQDYLSIDGRQTALGYLYGRLDGEFNLFDLYNTQIRGSSTQASLKRRCRTRQIM